MSELLQQPQLNDDDIITTKDIEYETYRDLFEFQFKSSSEFKENIIRYHYHLQNINNYSPRITVDKGEVIGILPKID